MLQKAEQSLREIDIGYYVSHYLNLIGRWNLYILLAGPVVAAGWVAYIFTFGSIKPDLEAVATLVIENAQGVGVSRYQNESTQSGIEFIRSRNFLSAIASQLSLRLYIPDYQRSDIFDSVYVDSTAPSGQYRFVIGKEMQDYQLFFTSKEYGVQNKLVESGELYKLNSFSQNGTYLQFSDHFLKEPHAFKYSVDSKRGAVERLLKAITVQNRELVRNGPMYVSIVSKGRDYPIITQSSNAIVDKFIDMSKGSRELKAKENIAILERQLQTAAEQLRITQDSADNFRRRYPNVGLGIQLMNNVNALAALESGSVNNSTWAEEAQRIRSRLAMASASDQELYVKEALVFLAGRGVTAAAVLQQEFMELTARQQELAAGYDVSHPYVVDNKTRISEVRSKTEEFLSEYATSSAAKAYRQSSQIQGLTSQLRGIPVLQSQLAELERQVEVTSKIHSEILSRYNQAKISDDDKTAGIYVMDYAIEPFPPSDFINILLRLGIGILIGLTISLGPPIVADMFDKTARNESDLAKLLDITILESIPEINNQGSVGSSKKNKSGANNTNPVAPRLRAIEEKLITANYTPDFTNELFRSLRAKIMLRMHDVDKKMLLVTSHGMNEGKSLIGSNLAITMAQQQLRTVLIDGDIRRGVIHNSFVLHKKPGLSNFLFSESPVTVDSVRELLQSTHVPNLSVVSSGVNVPNPSELLSLPRFQELVECLKEMYDIIIFDTPPLGVAADAAIASNLFSACIIVVRAGSTNVINLRKKLLEFPNLKKRVIGVVLNGVTLDKRMKEYKYSMYHY